jgi:hypothetical protein
MELPTSPLPAVGFAAICLGNSASPEIIGLAVAEATVVIAVVACFSLTSFKSFSLTSRY